MSISSFYYYIQAGQIIPSATSHCRVSRIHQLLSPNPLPLFNSSSPATAQKPLPPIRHICGLGASVGCERVERTFNAPRLKAQIWLMKFTGFVCCLLNELNRKWKDLGTRCRVFYLLENDWKQGDDLAFLMVISAIFQ